MATKKTLGLFWDNNGFHFAQAENNLPTKIFSVPFRLLRDVASSGAKETVDGAKLTDILQKSLKDQAIQAASLNLCIPMKDIIFRTFIIPWMQSSEVTGVVEFEAQKYVPFNLEDLSYTHHAVTIQEAKRKQ